MVKLINKRSEIINVKGVTHGQDLCFPAKARKTGTDLKNFNRGAKRYS